MGLFLQTLLNYKVGLTISSITLESIKKKVFTITTILKANLSSEL